MASSSNPPTPPQTSAAIAEHLQCYLHASNANVSNFVSGKLIGKQNYYVWKTQMLCLMESHDMCGIVDASFDSPNASGNIKTMKKYNSLLKGWIFGSINDDALAFVVNFSSAEAVWEALDFLYNISFQRAKQEAKEGYGAVKMIDIKREEREKMECIEKLHKATKEGNWPEVRDILYKATKERYWPKIRDALTEYKDAEREDLGHHGNTALHLHASNANVSRYSSQQVDTKNKEGETVLHCAARCGNTDAARLLVKSYNHLLLALDNGDKEPLTTAYTYMQMDTFRYLYGAYGCFGRETSANEERHTEEAIEVLVNTIFDNQFGTAFEMVTKFPKLAVKSEDVLMAIASTFPRGLTKVEKVIYPFTCINKIMEKKGEWEKANDLLKLVCDKIDEFGKPVYYNRSIVKAAARQNAYRVVEEILLRSPKSFMTRDGNGRDIIQLAVMHRSENFHNLINHIGEQKHFYGTLQDGFGNNILHLVAQLAPSHELKPKRGPALQLQRELQWFKEVKKLLVPKYVFKENIFKETPDMVFTREHENMVKEGGAWMKTTAESCSIIAALITTITFAATITVPGGSDQVKGIPLLTEDIAFNIFAISNAISLFTSSTSLLTFLSILTARFAEQDFLVRLPNQMIIGLCTLLFSVTSMMVAFSATLFIVFYREKPWMLGPISGLASLPIAIFVGIQFPLLVELFESTCGHHFGKPKPIIDYIREFLNKYSS